MKKLISVLLGGVAAWSLGWLCNQIILKIASYAESRDLKTAIVITLWIIGFNIIIASCIGIFTLVTYVVDKILEKM